MATPDFIIIGAMKCGTTTLQTQLAAQPGVFMSTPKEPNFFSDDAVFARGVAWYESLFDRAPPDALKGEASTHYAKLPTYPACADRLAAALPDVRLIYLVRDPFARLVSHYIHEWTMGVIRVPLDEAVDSHPELVDYSRYAMQIAPYVARFGSDRIHVTSLERLNADPDGELARIGVFIGLRAPTVWRREQAAANVSSERLRRFPLRGLLVDNPLAETLRRRLVPQPLRDAVKARLRMRRRPALSAARRASLAPVFDADRAELERLFPALRAPAAA